MKLRRTFLSYLMYLSFIFVAARQIPISQGVFLGVNVALTIILTAGLVWIIVHPFLLVVEDGQVRVYRDFFRFRKFSKEDVRFDKGLWELFSQRNITVQGWATTPEAELVGHLRKVVQETW